MQDIEQTLIILFFFKKLLHKLSPLLCYVYIEALQLGSLPLTLSQATILVLLREDKDPRKCESYHPGCLIGCHCEILTKVLAIRFKSVMPTIIHIDQLGFTTGRQLFSNLH